MVKAFMTELKDKWLVCLNITDECDFVDPSLVRLPQSQVSGQPR